MLAAPERKKAQPKQRRMMRAELAVDRHLADKDGDHKLDFDEFSELARKRSKRSYTEEELRARFDALDQDGSGQVEFHEFDKFAEQEEILERIAAARQRADKDGDHKLDFDEFCALVRDAEGDGLSVAELRARFDAIDADGSGVMELSEFAAYEMQRTKELLSGPK